MLIQFVGSDVRWCFSLIMTSTKAHNERAKEVPIAITAMGPEITEYLLRNGLTMIPKTTNAAKGTKNIDQIRDSDICLKFPQYFVCNVFAAFWHIYIETGFFRPT